MIHFAGMQITVGPKLRQRCAWCGAVLIDYDLENIAVPVGQDPTPATWPAGALIAVQGVMSTTVEHQDGERIPAGTCFDLDPAVTR